MDIPLGYANPHPLTYHSPLASPVSHPAVITKPFSAPVALDIIVPSSPVVQNTLHKVVDSTLPTSTPFPVPASGASTPHGPSLPVSFGGDEPANSADSGFSDVPDVISPAIPTPTDGQPQGMTAAKFGGPVDTLIPNGQTISPGPLPSALPPGISITTAPTTTPIPTISPSIFSGYVIPFGFVLPLRTSHNCMSSFSQIDLFAHHRPFDHDNDDHDKFKSTSLFTTTTEVVSYSLAEISGKQTSMPITETIATVLPTVVPLHSHRSPNRLATRNSRLVQVDDDMPLTVLFQRSVPVAVIAAPILSVAVIIALVLAVLRRRWRLQHQQIQARIQWPTFVGFSQVREMHQESMLRSREEGPPSLPPLQSTVGWNDPSPGAFTFGEPAQDPFAPTPPMIFRPLPGGSSPLDRPLSIRTIRRVPVPDPFLSSSGRTSSSVGSPERPNRLSQASSHDEHAHAATNIVRLPFVDRGDIYLFFPFFLTGRVGCVKLCTLWRAVRPDQSR